MNLDHLSITVRHLSNSNKKPGYYILSQNYNKEELEVFTFSENEIGKANYVYGELENRNDPDVNFVLVSATSFDTLKAAYPNYFADISEFVKMKKRILS